MDRELETLTSAEREALRLVAEGRTSKEVARALGISASAVNQRIDGARQKLGGITRLEAARRLRAGACDPITGDRITVVDGAWTAPLPASQPDLLRVEERRVEFTHEPLLSSREMESADDLTSTTATLRSAVIAALLYFGLLLIAITVMRTANDLARPLLNLVR